MSKLSAKLTKQLLLLFLMFAVSLMFVAGAGAWGLGKTRTSADDLFNDHLETSQATDVVAQELDDAYQSAQAILLASDGAEQQRLTSALFTDVVPTVEVGLDRLDELHTGDPASERALVQQLIDGWEQFRLLWTPQSLLAAEPDRVAVEADLHATFDPLEGVADELSAIEEHDATAAHAEARRAYETSLILIGGVTVATLLIGLGLVMHVARRLFPQWMAPERAQAEFAEAMQLAADQSEAQLLLKRHLERALPTSEAAILNITDRGQRLEAVSDVGDSPLRETLEEARPSACKAIRSARPYRSQQGDDALVACQICDGCPGTSECTPLSVGGEIIGAVLINRMGTFDTDDERRIRDSITQAAPVIANLRNLAIAEGQAATDVLTGLPNQRSVHDTLKRMVSQASRTRTSLAALCIDLDHFKDINDTHGHGGGDEVLSAVGAALASVMRASDFAGRNGGEEFLVLLPSTGLEDAKVVAERIRGAMREITIPNLNRRITASIGIAIAHDGADGSKSLERRADVALYQAKANGRDRAEVAIDDLPALADDDEATPSLAGRELG